MWTYYMVYILCLAISKRKTVEHELWRFSRWRTRHGTFQIIPTKLQTLGFIWRQLVYQWCFLKSVHFLLGHIFKISNMRKSALLLINYDLNFCTSDFAAREQSESRRYLANLYWFRNSQHIYWILLSSPRKCCTREKVQIRRLLRTNCFQVHQ